ncbi:sugar transporter [Kockovaella imperatae]|uniref:Sugar transporter n=1 Tax=Kockovaella imperatae TaxID=4999 RepID=A0A1Y1UC93_9TREE|nr:sugar transporter [Kockovaella imperatae]ORX35622.1 sugar transporter [Kockovaella imperatae]
MTFLRGKILNWAITACAGSAFLLFGYDQGVMSGLLTGSAFTSQFPEIDTTEGANGSASLQGTVVAIYEIGCLFGSIFTFFFGERFGRRRTIMLGCAVLCIGAALQVASFGIPQLIVGRIVTGLGNGMNTSTVPVWHSETTQPHNRGRALAIELAINIFGVMTAYWVDYGFSFVQNPSQFRAPLALQIIFALVTILLIQFLPESPRWLLKHGRADQAKDVLDRLSVLEGSDRAERLEAELASIQHALAEEEAATLKDKNGNPVSAIRACFTNGKERYFHRVMLGVGSQFMQQLCGINLITYYAPVIFEQSVGLSHHVSLLLSGFNGIAYFFSSLIPISLIDRIGRRKLMLFAAAGQCACMAILAGTTSVTHKATGIVAATMLFLFNFFFAVGLLAIPWLLPAEYAPLPIRASAAALASASNWIFTFLVVEITPVSIKNIGHNTYIYFCVFNFCFLPLIYCFYPETANLSLEQIDLLFTGDKVYLHLPSGLAHTSTVSDSEHGTLTPVGPTELRDKDVSVRTEAEKKE